MKPAPVRVTFQSLTMSHPDSVRNLRHAYKRACRQAAMARESEAAQATTRIIRRSDATTAIIRKSP